MSSDTDIDPALALVVEDVPAMRQRLAHLLSGVLGSDARVDTAASLAEARASLDSQLPGLAVIDIGLPDGNGIELIGWLRDHHPQVATVVVSAWGDEDTVMSALRNGAVGYLLKERDDTELTVALQNIQRGGSPIDPFVARRILAMLSTTPAPVAERESPAAAASRFSAREIEILQLVERGYSNREIGELVNLSRFTVESYTKAIYRKLAVRSRTAAIFEAKSRGLLH